MAEVVWPPVAAADLDALSLYIADFSPLASQRTAARIRACAAALATYPERGRSVGRGRRVLVVVAPYLIVYRLDGEVVTILRVRHRARRPLR
jgi:plasmid stabilization system protein ParE